MPTESDNTETILTSQLLLDVSKANIPVNKIEELGIALGKHAHYINGLRQTPQYANDLNGLILKLLNEWATAKGFQLEQAQQLKGIMQKVELKEAMEIIDKGKF